MTQRIHDIIDRNDAQDRFKNLDSEIMVKHVREKVSPETFERLGAIAVELRRIYEAMTKVAGVIDTAKISPVYIEASNILFGSVFISPTSVPSNDKLDEIIRSLQDIK